MKKKETSEKNDLPPPLFFVFTHALAAHFAAAWRRARATHAMPSLARHRPARCRARPRRRAVVALAAAPPTTPADAVLAALVAARKGDVERCVCV